MKKQNGNTGIAMMLFAAGMSMIVLVVFLTMWSWAHFRLWRADYAGQALEIERTYAGKANEAERTYRGKAILAEAEFSKKARIEEARAEKESAQLRADAIRIVGEAAKTYPEYRTQEFILSFGEALREGNVQQIIYVPTEAGIPILEAGKR